MRLDQKLADGIPMNPRRMANVLNTKPELIQGFCGYLVKSDDESFTLFADGRAVEISGATFKRGFGRRCAPVPHGYDRIWCISRSSARSRSGQAQRAGPSCHLGIEGSWVALAKSAVEIQARLLLTQACPKSSEVAAGRLVNRGQARTLVAR